MIKALEETFASDIAMNILKFCRHPCAEIIKEAYRYDPETDKCPYFFIPQRKKYGKEFLIMDDYKDERFWNNLIELNRLEREWAAEYKEKLLMGKNDYDVETGRKFKSSSLKCQKVHYPVNIYQNIDKCGFVLH